ncbi:hypothetical protein CEXT_517031 [Caerostris extrusa]|uniref:Uncharacterized protein n=1 Tax=Caerostris extrusa TaxID=172846 RepID=A0AAV4XXP6_CAEEX|nr:hypothetical protein CEXT_517031 [Caerostris extrusa]
MFCLKPRAENSNVTDIPLREIDMRPSNPVLSQSPESFAGAQGVDGSFQTQNPALGRDACGTTQQAGQQQLQFCSLFSVIHPPALSLLDNLLICDIFCLHKARKSCNGETLIDSSVYFCLHLPQYQHILHKSFDLPEQLFCQVDIAAQCYLLSITETYGRSRDYQNSESVLMAVDYCAFLIFTAHRPEFFHTRRILPLADFI